MVRGVLAEFKVTVRFGAACWYYFLGLVPGVNLRMWDIDAAVGPLMRGGRLAVQSLGDWSYQERG